MLVIETCALGNLNWGKQQAECWDKPRSKSKFAYATCAFCGPPGSTSNARVRKTVPCACSTGLFLLALLVAVYVISACFCRKSALAMA